MLATRCFMLCCALTSPPLPYTSSLANYNLTTTPMYPPSLPPAPLGHFEFRLRLGWSRYWPVGRNDGRVAFVNILAMSGKGGGQAADRGSGIHRWNPSPTLRAAFFPIQWHVALQESGRSFLCILKAGADRCSLLFPACTLRRIPPRCLQKERIYVQRLLLGLGAFTCLDSYTDS